jgi:hypothetical protein
MALRDRRRRLRRAAVAFYPNRTGLGTVGPTNSLGRRFARAFGAHLRTHAATGPDDLAGFHAHAAVSETTCPFSEKPLNLERTANGRQCH